jgi:hypothetical protein
MMRLALRQAVEIPSFARAATNFSELTGVALSESALQRLTVEYGSAVVQAEQEEATAMVQVPKAEEVVLWRKIPQPDSEVMAVSADGVLIHLREEGWKEVKVMSVSAVRTRDEQIDQAGGQRLEKHSYRAGLWDAKSFTPHYWAESARRGVEKAKQVVCISDGATWIWAMVFICFARRLEILDWWHLLQYLWQIVGQATELTTAQATTWIEGQKAVLIHSQPRQLMRNIRLLFPRGAPLPEAVRQAVVYIWHNRQRIDYAAYRQAGLPIGSGTIESAAKTVVQQRMKQAGMRWSRHGAQAMLALRSRLLSDRWHDLPI